MDVFFVFLFMKRKEILNRKWQLVLLTNCLEIRKLLPGEKKIYVFHTNDLYNTGNILLKK